MKTLGIAIAIMGLTASMCGGGAFSNQSGFMIAGFVMWTPAAVFLGWAFARSGLRITATTGETYAAPVNQRIPRPANNSRPRQPVKPAVGLFDEG